MHLSKLLKQITVSVNTQAPVWLHITYELTPMRWIVNFLTTAISKHSITLINGYENNSFHV